MTNLGWLRSRIRLALALPAAACSKDDGAKTKASAAHDAAPVAAKPIDAAPRPDAAVIADAAVLADAAIVPVDAAPAKPKIKWDKREGSCGGPLWCLPRANARALASTRERDSTCPTEIKVPKGERAPAGVMSGYDPGDGTCCYRDPIGGSGCKGRPFLDGERAVVAEADATADAWVAAALDEHASVASFARATLELMAVGAPPALIAGCQHAALDEIAHAQGCFAMAARRGCAVEPGPIEALAPRGGGLAAVARDTFVEGCVGETIGALLAAAQRDAAEDPEERALMTRIADDEARHAELAWQTVAWALARDPAIATALRATADRVRDASPAWRDVIDPTLNALLG